MAKIKLDASLYERVKKVARTAGYSSPDEFVIHIIEKELDKIEPGNTDDAEVLERLRGLGYIE